MVPFVVESVRTEPEVETDEDNEEDALELVYS
jgi:hypothetical protein